MSRLQQNIVYLGIWAILWGAWFFFRCSPHDKRWINLIGYLVGITAGGVFMFWITH